MKIQSRQTLDKSLAPPDLRPKHEHPLRSSTSMLQDSQGIARFRHFALALPGAVESSHMGSPDFRVNDRIFATLAYRAKGLGTLKLTLEQQAAFLAELPQLFEPAAGGWGRMGMTLLKLDAADDSTMQGALHTAHQNVVRKQAESSAKKRVRAQREP